MNDEPHSEKVQGGLCISSTGLGADVSVPRLWRTVRRRISASLGSAAAASLCRPYFQRLGDSSRVGVSSLCKRTLSRSRLVPFAPSCTTLLSSQLC